ncbi:MAG: hypothetical protein MI717_01025 [Spirochaetales bacterium]|nr:hypothetical protein [Spirochaetales bacterium]
MDYQGLQVFIAHSNADVGQKLVDELRRCEIEAYAVDASGQKHYDRRREAILCISNKDENEAFVREMVKSNSALHLIALGTEKTPVGWDQSFPEDDESVLDALVEYLDSQSVRGHRNYVRFGQQIASIATFAFQLGDHRYAGIVHDMSTTAISCTFKPEPQGMNHQPIVNLKLNMVDRSVTLSGRFTLRRCVSGQIIHVFRFDSHVSSESIDSLRQFIYASLERKLGDS